jgi:membrane dipeptidase
LPASERALAIVRRGPVVDLLVGSALFRDVFVASSGRGHADVPRLRRAGVRLVGLTVATRFPDLRGSLSNLHFRSLGAPASALRSNMALAEWLLGRIQRWCAESAGELRPVLTADELAVALAGDGIAVLLGVQGGHVLDGDLANIARLRDLGVRTLAPAHVMDNELVGSGTGRSAGGLSAFGREAIAELEAQSIIVDLAHMSAPGVAGALPLLKRPFLLSHTGLTDIAGRTSRWRRYSAATRNVPAALATEIGRRGGLVGVALATQLLGGDDLDTASQTIKAALRAAGGANVALGSDMDGALRTVVDAEGLPALADALLRAGLTEAEVAGFMGGNAVRFLGSALPA